MSLKKIVILIPARFASSRFPGKPLALILGKSMIQRVYERCVGLGHKDFKIKSFVVTDNDEIESHVKSFGGLVLRVDDDVPSGTERINLALKNFLSDEKFDLVLNIQGDEPLVEPKDLLSLIRFHLKNSFSISTLIKKRVGFHEEFQDINRVKVAWSENIGMCHYFSRSAIPYERGNDASSEWYLHIGVYSYTPEVLESFCNYAISYYEKREKLEQLRAIENGLTIGAVKTTANYMGIDCPEDIKKLEEFLREPNKS